jgi:hypothetical protein
MPVTLKNDNSVAIVDIRADKVMNEAAQAAYEDTEKDHGYKCLSFIVGADAAVSFSERVELLMPQASGNPSWTNDDWAKYHNGGDSQLSGTIHTWNLPSALSSSFALFSVVRSLGGA